MVTREEVIRKVTLLVKSKYGGDWQKAFKAEDKDNDNRISYDELEAILKEANVGFQMTRWAIAQAIVKELDADGDGFVSWEEFNAVFHEP